MFERQGIMGLGSMVAVFELGLPLPPLAIVDCTLEDSLPPLMVLILDSLRVV